MEKIIKANQSSKQGEQEELLEEGEVQVRANRSSRQRDLPHTS